MQINNNMSQQNFGMAFKIKGVDGAEWVSKQERITLDRLAKAAEDLKDTKFYHLFADADGLHVSKDGCKGSIYRGYRLEKPEFTHQSCLDRNLMEIPTELRRGSDINGLASRSISVPKVQSKDLVNELQTASNEVEKLVALTKALDAEANYKETVRLANEAAEKERKALADDLINKFSIEG